MTPLQSRRWRPQRPPVQLVGRTSHNDGSECIAAALALSRLRFGFREQPGVFARANATQRAFGRSGGDDHYHPKAAAQR